VIKCAGADPNDSAFSEEERRGGGRDLSEKGLHVPTIARLMK